MLSCACACAWMTALIRHSIPGRGGWPLQRLAAVTLAARLSVKSSSMSSLDSWPMWALRGNASPARSASRSVAALWPTKSLVVCLVWLLVCSGSPQRYRFWLCMAAAVCRLQHYEPSSLVCDPGGIRRCMSLDLSPEGVLEVEVWSSYTLLCSPGSMLVRRKAAAIGPSNPPPWPQSCSCTCKYRGARGRRGLVPHQASP